MLAGLSSSALSLSRRIGGDSGGTPAKDSLRLGVSIVKDERETERDGGREGEGQVDGGRERYSKLTPVLVEAMLSLSLTRTYCEQLE